MNHISGDPSPMYHTLRAVLIRASVALHHPGEVDQLFFHQEKTGKFFHNK